MTRGSICECVCVCVCVCVGGWGREGNSRNYYSSYHCTGLCLGDVEWWSKFNLQDTSIS